MKKIIISILIVLMQFSVFSLFAQDVEESSSSCDLTFKSVRFFEGDGITVPDLEDRVYKTYFKNSETRYVYYELYVENLKYGEENHTPFIKVVINDPDGEYFYTSKIENTEIESENQMYYLWNGFGYKEFSKWPLGKYKFQFYFLDKMVHEAYIYLE